MIIHSQFKPAWWLPLAHAQTIYPSLLRHIEAPVDHTERLELPDGDFIDLAYAINGLGDDSPWVIFLHGLGGSIQSSYIAGLMRACNAAGWRSVLMHFRGASAENNRLPRAYHSGDTKDFDFFIKQFALREPGTQKAAVGVSLGGNVLLKWLGEEGKQDLLQAAIAVSVPFELRMVADKINRGFSRVYQQYLLKRLRRVFIRKCAQLEGELPRPLQDFEKWDCFWTFDEKVTAPLHGFSGVHEYYRQSSCRQYLKAIKTNTLIIQAMDDPFMTASVIPKEAELSSTTTLELCKKGGHVGFIRGRVPGKPIYWLEERIPEYLRSMFE